MREGDDRGWFAPKSYGIGAGLPIAWQGWALLTVFLIVTIAAAIGFDDRPLVFFAILLPLTLSFLVVVARTTRGGWRWRWGEEE